MKKLIAEGVGTMFLVLLACGSAVLAGPTIGVLGIGICFGLVLICLCYAIGNISGCHVNPAVSFGMWIAGRMKTGEFIGYVVAQLIGATIGAAFLYALSEMGAGFTYGGITAASDNAIAANGHIRHGSSHRRPAHILLRIRDSCRYRPKERRRQICRSRNRYCPRPCKYRWHTCG